MPENTNESRDTEELGTTLYARGKEVTDVLNLIESLHFKVIDELDKTEPKALEAIYDHAVPLGKAMQTLGMRLNRNACGDSHERNGEPLALVKTDRGIAGGIFRDFHGESCSLSKSSTTRGEAIWLGTEGNQMHLTRPMVAALLPHLRRFVETGEL